MLAAVGIVSFGSYLGSAKENTAKANHSNMIKFMQAQVLKCKISSSTLDLVDPQGNSRPWVCDSNTANINFVERFREHFAGSIDNPYTPSELSVVPDSDCPSKLGQTGFSVGGDASNFIVIKTNFKSGASCLIGEVSTDE